MHQIRQFRPCGAWYNRICGVGKSLIYMGIINYLPTPHLRSSHLPVDYGSATILRFSLINIILPNVFITLESTCPGGTAMFNKLRSSQGLNFPEHEASHMDLKITPATKIIFPAQCRHEIISHCELKLSGKSGLAAKMTWKLTVWSVEITKTTPSRFINVCRYRKTPAAKNHIKRWWTNLWPDTP